MQARISAAAEAVGRDPQEITLVGASKTRTEAEVRLAYDAGLRIFGENYALELCHKAEVTKDLDLEWHFIGHLQRNKAKKLVPWLDMMHSVDSARLADALQPVADRRSSPLPVLIQVNVAGEASKSGVSPSDALALGRHIQADCPSLSLQGLMTMPPFAGDPSPWFEATRALRDDISQAIGITMPHLSMGMSGDLERAIACGATFVRVGTALFGPRG